MTREQILQRLTQINFKNPTFNKEKIEEFWYNQFEDLGFPKPKLHWFKNFKDAVDYLIEKENKNAEAR